MFRKINYPCQFPSAPDSYVVEERKQISNPNGGFDVVFDKVPIEKLSKQCLDPNLVTLEKCIVNNTFIEPHMVQSILNNSDVSDIEELSGRMSEEAYNYIRENEPLFDVANNTLNSKED